MLRCTIGKSTFAPANANCLVFALVGTPARWFIEKDFGEVPEW